jgi:ribose 5-phosphate isomerase B
MKISIACDHGAFEYKEIIKEMLSAEEHEVVDYGCHSKESMDYPDTAALAAKAVANKECERGIVICSTGIGVSIVANKVDGVRCALVHDLATAKLTREHNDTNVLALGQLTTGELIAKEIVKIWLNTPFSNEPRHQRRIDKVMALED